MIGAAFVLTCF